MFIMIDFVFLYLLMILISIFLLTINFFISMLIKNKLEKNLPFECGFNLLSKATLPFSFPFYLMSLMFLIFDAEIILLMPIIFSLNETYYFMELMIFLFLFILSVVLIIEWMNEYFKWLY